MEGNRQPKTVVIVQVRFSSQRLPGKVLKQVCGKPMLGHLLDRLKRCSLIDEIVIATSREVSDDVVASYGERLGFRVLRGPLTDVLERFTMAAELATAEVVVRITADCPLADPSIIDLCVQQFVGRRPKLDFLSNSLEPTFPDGLDVEVFSIDALRVANKNAVLPSHREHVTPYIIENTQTFSVHSYTNNEDLSSHRWTVDEPKDLEFIREVYHSLYFHNPEFLMKDILELLKSRPTLMTINSHIRRNAGADNSLEEDKKYLKGLHCEGY